jgi:hypothetical protein
MKPKTEAPALDSPLDLVLENGARITVMALVDPPMALHRCVTDESLWAITHIPTKSSLIARLPLEDALEMFDAVAKLKDETEAIKTRLGPCPPGLLKLLQKYNPRRR